MSVVLRVLLWARPGGEHLLFEYENQVLALLDRHQGRLLSRVRANDSGRPRCTFSSSRPTRPSWTSRTIQTGLPYRRCEIKRSSARKSSGSGTYRPDSQPFSERHVVRALPTSGEGHGKREIVGPRKRASRVAARRVRPLWVAGRRLRFLGSCCGQTRTDHWALVGVVAESRCHAELLVDPEGPRVARRDSQLGFS
jgi:hypothetical protein